MLYFGEEAIYSAIYKTKTFLKVRGLEPAHKPITYFPHELPQFPVVDHAIVDYHSVPVTMNAMVQHSLG